MKILTMAAMLAALTPLQTATSESAREIVEEWFERMSSLDGTEAAAEALVELYTDEGRHIAGPESHQRGAVTFRGHDQIRVMAHKLSDLYGDLRYRVEVATARESSEPLFHETRGPWGGPAVAVSFSYAFTRREDGVRFMMPGAAFFRLADGKIEQVRLILATSERAEVEPLK